ncbi:MAG: Asp-tRNA(Asn)/Glu-tRNA(Gln) amidotransferase subunit GatA [Candidatus Pacebacteria bacterium]|nr:Asp-tRNA(Asn)/Glu-tRNA(Gln) amidotransferase subunit GatA [Candidatus Paceibacterota bacterium]
MQLNKLTIAQAREQLDKKEISSQHLTQACLKQIEKHNSQLKACLTVSSDLAMSQAKEADKRLKMGETGPLLGIPYLAKDNLLTKDIKTTAGSKMLENYIAPYSATVVDKLEKAGAVLLGKTNLDEFAHGSSTENSYFGPSINPWDTNRVPGGSSGGSASAVASDMCLFALGSDTGGSIRQPASFCGITGLKPSYGRVSRFGLIAMTSSTDVIGPLTKSALDAEMVFSVISGKDEKDSTSYDNLHSSREFVSDISKVSKIGWVKEHEKDLSPEVKEALLKTRKKLESLGATFIDISLPNIKYAVPVYYIITPAEVSSNLARFDGLRFGFSKSEASNLKDYYLQTRGEGFGPEAKRRIMLGTYVLSAGYFDAYYLQAQRVRENIISDFDKVFSEVDLILTPSATGPAFRFGEKTNPLDMYIEDKFLAGPSLAGLPSISLPTETVKDLPFGFQLVGSKSGEDMILKVAKSFQENTNYHLEKPSLP